MEIKDYTIKRYNNGNKFSLYIVADAHQGNPGHDHFHYRDYIKKIKNDPNAYWVGLGDYADWISLGDKRFKVSDLNRKDSISTLDNFWVKVTDEVAEKLEPIMDRCLGLSYGNHEMSVCNTHQFDPVAQLCKRFNVHNLGWASFIRLKFMRESSTGSKRCSIYIIHCSHGTIASRKKGNKINRMEDVSAHFEADIYLKAHGHDALGSIGTKLNTQRKGTGSVEAHNMLFMMSPSFLKTYNLGSRNYGEIQEYPPTSMGEAKIEIEPFVNIPKMRLVMEVCSGKYQK